MTRWKPTQPCWSGQRIELLWESVAVSPEAKYRVAIKASTTLDVNLRRWRHMSSPVFTVLLLTVKMQRQARSGGCRMGNHSPLVRTQTSNGRNIDKPWKWFTEWEKIDIKSDASDVWFYVHKIPRPSKSIQTETRLLVAREGRDREWLLIKKGALQGLMKGFAIR